MFVITGLDPVTHSHRVRPRLLSREPMPMAVVNDLSSDCRPGLVPFGIHTSVR
jgi:hypothetical protein